ncbi:MAG: hypothetical protein FWD56_02900 [Bacteroidales bacterium]|nr:hypothetical protein [Bacteroidales bacterium]
MKTNRLLLLSVLLFVGAGVLGSESDAKCKSNVPPTLEEIHFDWIGGMTPPKPKTIFFPVRAWHNSKDHSLIIAPNTQTGWLTVCLEDEFENLLLREVVDGDGGRISINLPFLYDGYYLLTIEGEQPDPFVLGGWIKIE